MHFELRCGVSVLDVSIATGGPSVSVGLTIEGER